MTTQTNNSDSITLDQLRKMLSSIYDRIDNLAEVVDQMREGLAQAASQPAATQPASGFVDFLADTFLLSYDDNGEQVYKLKGGQYTKYGVRVWPEVLPLLGIDPAVCEPGPNPVNMYVRAILSESGQPRKVIGLSQ